MDDCKNKESPKKITFSLKPNKKFLYTLLAAVGVIFVWKGIWDLLNLYLFPNNPLLSALISLFIGLIILYLPDQDIKELL
jgi:hypothetical protein